MAVLYSDPVFLEHETGIHPESPARIAAIRQMIDHSSIPQRWTMRDSVPAGDELLELVHTHEYVAEVQEFAKAGGGHIEGDTVVCPQSDAVAHRAAGTAAAAVDEILNGAHQTAVCLIRPPGHHALPDSAMGFCLFNNVAIAAKHAITSHGLSRVLIVDWDVHHGNGTQDMFYESPEVFFLSVHRSPFYPGTGAANETGRGAGAGTTFNLPLAFGISRQEYRERFHSILSDAVARSRPELILVSAGFDAHAADPVGSLGLETEDFCDLTRLVMDAADAHCDGKIVSLLEGGYNVTALAESVECHLNTLVPEDVKNQA